MGFHVRPLLYWSVFLLFPKLLSAFVMKGCWVLSYDLYVCWDDHVIFVAFIMLICYITQGNPCLISKFRDLHMSTCICLFAFQGLIPLNHDVWFLSCTLEFGMILFCRRLLYLCQLEYWPIVLFSHRILVWLWYQCNTGFKMNLEVPVQFSFLEMFEKNWY